MTTDRESILNRLRAARQPYTDLPPLGDHLPMVPLPDTSPGALLARFVEQTEKLACVIHRTTSDAAAVEAILSLAGGETHVLCWAFEHIPLAGLADALRARQVAVADPRDPSAQFGITGVDAALAATGSLVLTTGPGKGRAISLLPGAHIAVVRSGQIVADFESWAAGQRARGLDAFQQVSSAMIISGPSRTADIAMQLIMGMHGPRELHVVLIEDRG